MSLARPLIAALLALLAACACAGAAHADEVTEREQRLEAVVARISALDRATDQSVASGTPASPFNCQDLFAGIEDDLNRSWSQAAFVVWVQRADCTELESGGWARRQRSLLSLQADWKPVLAHFAAMPARQREEEDREVRVAFTYWEVMRHFGHQAQADALELQAVERWLAQAKARPDDALAQGAVQQITRYMYGQRARGSFIDQLHQLFAQRLGGDNLHTLAMLRARIYYQRQMGRPAQALTLSDELVALLARHTGAHSAGVERLAMANRSERVGALAGVGRYADALDEGRLLLDWLGRQKPVSHANLMRSAYNLAGLSILMADHDEAVRYARRAIDEGLQAPSYLDRHETWFPTLLLAHARLMRGDADAGEALEVAIAGMPPKELAVAHTLVDLERAAGRAGQSQRQAKVHALLVHLVESTTTTLQAERALPLLLAAEAAPVGSDPALSAGAQALAYGLVGRDAPLSAQAHFGLARQVAVLDSAGAVWLYKRGTHTLQALRRGLPEAADGNRGAYTQGYDGDLRAFVGLLIDSGRLSEAEQALELLRDEELHEFRRRSRGAPLALSLPASGLAAMSYTPDEQQRNGALQPWVKALQDEAAAADQRSDQQPTMRDRTELRDPAAQQALAQAAQAVRQLALQPAVRTNADDRLPGAAGRGTAPPAAPTLPAGVARLSYFVRPAAVELVLQTATGRQRVSLPHSSTDINRAVQRLRAELQRPALAVPSAARALHRLLIEPLGGRLAGIRHLHVVPDGALRYVPFAALHDGRRYLAQRFSVSTELGRPSDVGAPSSPRPRAVGNPPAHLVAFGRTLGDEHHSALPGVQQEMAVLGALQGARVARALDAQFTASGLSQALASGPQVVHLASHFVLDVAGEEASYLLLGDGTRLPLRALRELPWAGVQLALLSACDTGLALDGGGAAGAPAQGRELAGFAATLHAAGVQNVMATLWRVDDASTAQWMQAFYAPWRSGSAPHAFTAQHLAHTQRQWLRRHAGTPLAHPYHWAAFSWMGQPA